MLMSAIRLASEAYHVNQPLKRFHDSYIREKRWECWERADPVEMADVERLILSLNQWKTRYATTDVSRTALLGAVREVIPLLQPLRNHTILDECNYCRFTLRNDLAWIDELRRQDGR